MRETTPFLVFNIPLQPGDISLRDVIAFAETKAVTGCILKEYITVQILEDSNVLARICEETEGIGQGLRQAALQDLEACLAAISAPPALLFNYKPSIQRHMHFGQFEASLVRIVETQSTEDMLDAIIRHYRSFGGGKSARHVAFLWDGGLVGIDQPDDIALDSLYCLDRQKKELQDNTLAFLRGLPANNVLLYGNSGCGKSSMVKAILNSHYHEGLRLVQIRKEHLPELPQLIRQLKHKQFFFIIYMDDLSFEVDDLGYKTLKTILDGSVEKQPGNILFYATSNRLHLISETWAERAGEDVHVGDTKNEKLSLSERFGIRISFLSPDQREYVQIIAGILARHGIPMTDAIEADAIRFAWQCNGLSGRTATQFLHTLLPSYTAP